MKSSQIVLGTFVGIIIVFFIFGESFFSFSSSGDARFPNFIQFVQAIRIDYFNKGLILALVISISFSGLIWGYVHSKISKNLFSYSLFAILIMDLWILNNEFLSLTKKKNFKGQFVKILLLITFLMMIVILEFFQLMILGLIIMDIGVFNQLVVIEQLKLRNYQDLMDAGGFKRPTILNMLNVKYLLTKKQ